MKNQLAFLSVILIFITTSISAQVRVGGGVSIDVSLDFPPIPEVIVVNRKPNSPRPCPNPRERRVNIPEENRCQGNCKDTRVSRYGEIRNQNGRYGLQVYKIRNAQLLPLRNGLETVIYQLDSGDVLELVIATANSQDYNYHFSKHQQYSNNNKIVKVLLNNNYLDLRDGSLSLQPTGQQGFHSVVNLHSVYEGDFNGTVNF